MLLNLNFQEGILIYYPQGLFLLMYCNFQYFLVIGIINYAEDPIILITRAEKLLQQYDQFYYSQLLYKLIQLIIESPLEFP